MNIDTYSFSTTFLGYSVSLNKNPCSIPVSILILPWSDLFTYCYLSFMYCSSG